MSATKLKIIGITFMCLSVFFAGLSIYFYFKNNSSQAEIKTNLAKIETLEKSKIPLKDSIAVLAKRGQEKDEIIQGYKDRELQLLNKFKKQENEKAKNITDYLNDSDDKRLESFTKFTE